MDDNTPFAILGIGQLANPRVEDVRSAFRQAALASHPDKARGCNVENGARFARLVAARDSALSALTVALPLPSAPTPAEDERLAWAVWVAAVVLACTTAPPIDIAVDATLTDLYDARVKRVVISVVRVRTPHHPVPFSRRRQALLVRLALPSRDSAVDSAAVVFAGLGDDPVADVLLNRRRKDVRGDVRVHVRLSTDPRSSPSFSMQPDTVLFPSDLHANVAVSLRGYYMGETVYVDLPSSAGDTVRAEYVGGGDDEASGRGDRRRQVRVYKGRGLPYLSGEPRTPIAGRGDLYVFMDVLLPTLGIDRLSDPDVQGALKLLSAAFTATEPV